MIRDGATPHDSETLFDSHGRRIPVGLSALVHANIRRRFVCDQPKIDYAAIHGRLTKAFNADGAISAADFQSRAEAILDRLNTDPRVKNVTNAVAVPFFLPKTPGIASADIGQALDEVYIGAVERSFTETLPDYAFTNHHKNPLAGQLTVIPASRHQRLLDAMQNDVVVGYFFISLSEYPVPMAIEQMATLPESFLLAGGVDTCAALIGSPELLLKTDGYPPLLWLSALQSGDANAGFHFEAYGYNLTFNRRLHFGQLGEYWDGGLVVLDTD